jgi:hypothetical protein
MVFYVVYRIWYCFVVYIKWYCFVVYIKWYLEKVSEVVCLWFTESGMYVVYKRWYVSGLHNLV